MNYIDIILLILLLFAAINGFRKGFIAELASLAALVLGIWGAIEFSHITADFLENTLNVHTKYLYIISLVVTFVVIVILVHIIGSTISRLVEAAMLGFVNKLAGLVFGILRAALILSILLVVFEQIDDDMEIISDKTKAESRLYDPILEFAPSLLPFLDFLYEKDIDQTDQTPQKVS